MTEESTILISKETIELLKKAKENPRQTYNDLLVRLVKMYIEAKKGRNNSYDRFLHEIQKKKMKELWDNEYDEKWEKV